MLLGCSLVAQAAGPVETSVFAVQGVAVDVTDTDAATAKNKALVEVQVKAFRHAWRSAWAMPEVVAEMSKPWRPRTSCPYLRSLSIEQESISPGRYQGKLTVRFLPEKIKAFYSKPRCPRVVAGQGPAFLVLPMWKSANGPQLWEDNPWRQAWINLRAEQSQVPIIVPLGDLDDSEIISAQDVLSGDEVKLEAIRRRYDVKTVLVAFAEPDRGWRHPRHDERQHAPRQDHLRQGLSRRQRRPARIRRTCHLTLSSVMIEKFHSDASKQAAAIRRR